MPKRIQRRRTKGWRMPPNAVYVGRPTRWGNPFTTESMPLYLPKWENTPESRQTAFALWVPLGFPWTPGDENEHRRWMAIEVLRQRGDLLYHIKELRGKDLACWCALDRPCHADVLLELANREG